MRSRSTAPTEPTTSLLTRRRLLAGGMLTTGAAVATACAIGDPDPDDAVAPGVIPVARVPAVPADDPGSDVWKYGYEVSVTMADQLIALPFRLEPFQDSIRVRAVHDGTSIGFRVSWADADASEDTVPCDGFRDACAVLLAPGEGDEGLRVMGSAETAATMLHWKADWQYDVDHGVRSVRDSFPNVAVDQYPPLATHTEEITPSDYVAEDATEWLPGLHVGNALSAPSRTTPVEKLTAFGFGTVAHAETQNAVGRGERGDGSWRATLVKPLDAVDTDEVALRPGATYTCAFAIWSGSSGDAGGRKTPSANAYRLELAP